MSGKAGDCKATELISVDSTSSIVALAEKFQSTAVGSFPVVDYHHLIAIISRSDILSALVLIE